MIRPRFAALTVSALLAAGGLLACRREPPPPPAPPPPVESARQAAMTSLVSAGYPISFREVGRASGIDFVHESGAAGGRRWLPETMGPGVAIFDADGDGWPDLYLVNGKAWDDPRAAPGRLYRSLGRAEGRPLAFADVTESAGLGRPFMGMGAAVGDVDGDGQLDLLVTGLDEVRLYRNQGGGRFVDATAGSGLPTRGWWTSAAFLDFDRDGRLDLLVARYVDWSPKAEVRCSLDGKTRAYCGPERFSPSRSVLLRGDGEGHFSDVTALVGMAEGEARDKALGVAAADLDGDGYPEIAVANDTMPNHLWKNLGPGADGQVRFRDIGPTSGMGVLWEGKARAGMGLAWARLDGDDHWLAIGNFSHEMTSLYATSDGAWFQDRAMLAGLGYETRLSLTFGLAFADLDGDGFLDLALANGHVEPSIGKVEPAVSYAQPQLLFRGQRAGFFRRVPAADLGDFSAPAVGRGLAVGDLDRDGALDLVLTTSGGAPRVLLNTGNAGERTVRLRLAMPGKNRQAIGAVATLVLGGRRQTRAVSGGDSYLSASERRLFFAGPAVDEAEVRWPDGETQRLEGLAPGHSYLIEKGQPPRPD
jgi:hypothetical protein